NRSGITNIPFVMSVHGIISPDTLADMENLITHAVNPRQLRSDILANTQMELLRAIHQGVQILSASLLSNATRKQGSTSSNTANDGNDARASPQPGASGNHSPGLNRDEPHVTAVEN